MAKALKKRRKPKADGAAPQNLERIVYVQFLLAAGMSSYEVIEWCGRVVTAEESAEFREQGHMVPAKTWKCVPRSARALITAARKAWFVEHAQSDVEKDRAVQIAQAEQHRKLALARGDFNAANRALDIKARLTGTYEAERVRVDVAAEVEPVEAVKLIKHAHATLALMQARGAAPVLPAPAPVIDAEATERAGPEADELEAAAGDDIDPAIALAAGRAN